jgi:hypothetical protein
LALRPRRSQGLYVQRRKSPLPNVVHPAGKVRLTRAFAESLIPLLKLQSCFAEVKLWDGEPVDLDLDGFRASGFPHSRGDIALYYSHVWACQPRLWQPWLTVEAEPNSFILVNRTQRYHNPRISYKFLATVPNVRFVGLAEEYKAFRKEQGVNVPHLKTRGLLDLAKAIAGCRLFVGNQSAAWTIAEGLKVKRLVEMSPDAPNCAPHGPNGSQIWKQEVLEELVKESL